MGKSESDEALHFPGEINLLFYQRTVICLWLGVIFFSLFLVLDYVCYPDLTILFGFYRLVFVILLLLLLLLLRLPLGRKNARSIMYFGMLVGAMTISLMVLELGGFKSGYYVGILLMMAGGFTVLPLTFLQATGVGMTMYFVYTVTVISGTASWNTPENLQFALNNTFFFLSIIGVTATQCYDDLNNQIQALQVKRRLRKLTGETRQYRDNLEEQVIERMRQQEETELRFRDLYDKIDDLILVVDAKGIIRKFNRRATEVLGLAKFSQGAKRWVEYLTGTGEREVEIIQEKLTQGKRIRGHQIQLTGSDGDNFAMELSGDQVSDDPETDFQYQLILRDITATKEIEWKILQSRQLIDSSRQAAIFGLAHLAECRDGDTGTHLQRMREYTLLLTEKLAESPEMKDQIDDSFMEDIYRTSVLHDIGKVAVPDEILLKPGSLSNEEMTIMQGHCRVGFSVLKDAEFQAGGGSFLTMAQEITLCHHERWDGTGYPLGLVGDAIPLAARIVALADVYDALTSTRPYKPAYSHDQSFDIIVNESGKHFDPIVVEAFQANESAFITVRKDLLLS